MMQRWSVYGEAAKRAPEGAALYINTRETVGYILFDWADGFDIGDMGEMFLTRIRKSAAPP